MRNERYEEVCGKCCYLLTREEISTYGKASI